MFFDNIVRVILSHLIRYCFMSVMKKKYIYVFSKISERRGPLTPFAGTLGRPKNVLIYTVTSTIIYFARTHRQLCYRVMYFYEYKNSEQWRL